MKDHAEFTYKMQDAGKRAVHIVGWHLWHAPANALRVVAVQLVDVRGVS
jgi:hypothetical protein